MALLIVVDVAGEVEALLSWEDGVVTVSANEGAIPLGPSESFVLLRPAKTISGVGGMPSRFISSRIQTK